MNFSYLTDFLDRLPQQGVPGCDCIIAKNNKTIYRHLAGLSSVEDNLPMVGSELFYLYSITKVFTSVAVLQLAEKGLVWLGDPLFFYLPEFKDMMVQREYPGGDVVLKRCNEKIRIIHLLSMCAGMSYEVTEEICQAVRASSGHAPTEEIVRAMAKIPLRYEPGTRFSYSFAYDVLGRLIEVVSGKSLGEYMSDEIFRPLGMENTGFSCNDSIRSRMMRQYCNAPDRWKRLRIDSRGMAYWEKPDGGAEPCLMQEGNPFIFGDMYESGGAGLISSAEDCAIFANALANMGMGSNGVRILSPASVRLMKRNQLNDIQLADYTLHGLPGYGYGLGVRTMMDPSAAGSLSSVGEFGWSGAAGCFLLADTELNLSMFFAAHARGNMDVRKQLTLVNLVYSGICE